MTIREADEATFPAASLPTLPVIEAFVGRREELEALEAQLASQHLVAITGKSGVGKTALAVELARRVAGAAPERIFWYTFLPQASVDTIIGSVAEFLAWHGQPEIHQTLCGIRVNGGQLPQPKELFPILIEMLREHRATSKSEEQRKVHRVQSSNAAKLSGGHDGHNGV